MVFQVPIAPILSFILVFIRILLFLSLMPIFGESFTPLRVRLLLAVAVSFLFTPILSSNATDLVFPQTFGQMIALMIPEVMLGLAFGLIGRILFGAVQFAGAVMSEQIGFGMANVVDPSNAIQIPIVAELFYVFSILLFFITNAHHFFLAAMARSFAQAPPGALHTTSQVTMLLSHKAGEMFWIGVQISLPIVAVVFATNVAMAMLAKGVPQINVFLESFPIRIIVGLFMVAGAMSLMARLILRMIGGAEQDLLDILQAMSR